MLLLSALDVLDKSLNEIEFYDLKQLLDCRINQTVRFSDFLVIRDFLPENQVQKCCLRNN